jgi:hypothetical protein
MRRLLLLPAICTALLLGVGPVAGAEVVHYKYVGSEVNAGFADLKYDPDTGWLVPGTYEWWWLSAGGYVDTSGAVSWACAQYARIVAGNFNQFDYVRFASGCGVYDELTVNPAGIRGHATATVPVTDCIDQDADSAWDCASLGAFTFDVDVTDKGPIEMVPGKYKGAGAMVTPGEWTESWHQMQLSRLSGKVTGAFSLAGFGPLPLDRPGTTSQLARYKTTAVDVYP